MPRKINRLIATKIDRLPPGRHHDGNGLTLTVRPHPSTSKSWALVVYVNGKSREMGLGSYPEVGLADAREAAAAAKAMARKGIDPIAARKAMRTSDNGPAVEAAPKAPAKTFGQVAADHMKVMSCDWENDKTRQGWENSLLNHCAALRDIPVQDISVDHVLSVLEPIWNAKPEIARLTQERIAAVLDHAKAKNHRHGDNPADWETRLKFCLPAKRKLSRGPHASMPFTEAPAFMRRLRAERDGNGARALEFTILTAVRSGESMLAKWGEFDLTSGLWHIPLERVKIRKVLRRLKRTAHTVPLSPDAQAILKAMARAQFGSAEPDPDEWVFPGYKAGRPISNGAMERVLDRMSIPVTVHGYRSTFRGWASRRKLSLPETGRTVPAYSWEACELCLGHVAGGEAERAYLREECVEERREILEDWADFLAGRPLDRAPTTLSRLAA